MPDDRERLIQLNLVPEIGSARLRRLLEAFGTLDALWVAPQRALEQLGGLKPELAERLAACRTDAARLRGELEAAVRADAAIITLADQGYPERLRAIADPPPVLYVSGAFEPADATAVAIVGARHASAYGLQCAERLAYELALRGVTIVSGLARGIDAAAHRGALTAGGRTVAVLGSGLSRVYPDEHAALADQVARQGAVLSEYPMASAPMPYNFPRRNRIISGLSLGVVVVEAARRSGALITADCALEQGREVFAVPGPMAAATSQGTHELIKQGARLVTSVEDIVEELRLTPAGPRPADARPDDAAGAAALPEAAQRVLACVSREPMSIDAIAGQTGVGASEASSLLLDLELRRMIRQLPGKQFVRA